MVRFAKFNMKRFTLTRSATGRRRPPNLLNCPIFNKTLNGDARANYHRMILLITPSARGPECAATLTESTGNPTHWAENLALALTHLREQTFTAVVLDQFLLETEPAESDRVLEHIGTAIPVYLNFAVSGMERLVREVRSALHRRKREEIQARLSVERQFRCEMGESLTAMLLSCELAMAIPDIPAPAAEKILAVNLLAREMRTRLGAN
jgi:hypothetical protein